MDELELDFTSALFIYQEGEELTGKDKARYKLSEDYELFELFCKKFPIMEALDLILGIELVRNAAGSISAAKSLDACENEEAVSAAKLVAILPRGVLVRGLSQKDALKDDLTPLIPVWMMLHKKAHETLYKEWSSNEDDLPKYAFGKQIFEGIEFYSHYAKDFPEMVEKVVSDSYQYQDDVGKNDFAPAGILDLPKDGESKGTVPSIPNRIILQMWWAAPDFRTELMITNYSDWDTFQD